MKRLVSTLLGLSLVFLVGCTNQPRSGSYMVVVKDRATGKVVDGASVEVVPLSGPPVTGTTDSLGEAVLLIGAWPRAELRVGFDGETDRYYVRTTKVPTWEASAEETGSGEKGVLVFMPGGGGGINSSFEVHFMLIREGLP